MLVGLSVGVADGVRDGVSVGVSVGVTLGVSVDVTVGVTDITRIKEGGITCKLYIIDIGGIIFNFK